MFDLILLDRPHPSRALRAIASPLPHSSPRRRKLVVAPPGVVATNTDLAQCRRMAASFEALGAWTVITPAVGPHWLDLPGPSDFPRSPLLADMTREQHRRARRHLMLQRAGGWPELPPRTENPMDELRDALYTASKPGSWWRRRTAWFEIWTAFDASNAPDHARDYALEHVQNIPGPLRTALPYRRAATTTLADNLDHDAEPRQHLQTSIATFAFADALPAIPGVWKPTRLSLCSVFLNTPDTLSLSLQTNPRNLTHLDLSGARILGDLSFLDRWRFGALQWLDLTGLRADVPHVLRTLEGAPLDTLILDHAIDPLGPEAFEAIAALGPRHLSLRGLREPDQAHLHDLCGNGAAQHLLSLDLSSPAAFWLPEPAQLPALQHLGLAKTPLDIPNTGALAHFLAQTSLQSLDLRANRLDEGHLGILAPHLRTRHLRLDQNALSERASLALAHSPNLAALESLRMAHNPLGPGGAAALAGSPHLRGLTLLDLGACLIGDDGLEALAQSPVLASVTDLGLWHNGLTDRGIEALARSPFAHGLKRLHLSNNAIGDRGLRALLETAWIRHLEELHLGDNTLTSAAIDALIKADPLPHLDYLDLNYNKIDNLGARTLAKANALSSIALIELRGNPITNEGVRALSASTHLKPWQWSTS